MFPDFLQIFRLFLIFIKNIFSEKKLKNSGNKAQSLINTRKVFPDFCLTFGKFFNDLFYIE